MNTPALRIQSMLLEHTRRTKGVPSDGTMMLCTKGPNKKTITFGAPKPQKKFSLEEIIKLKLAMNLSGKATKLMAMGIRTVLGRDSIEPGLMDELKELNHRLAGFFMLKDICIIKKVDGVETLVHRNGVFCKDLKGLIQLLIEVRDIEPGKEEVQVSFDDGKGKVLFSSDKSSSNANLRLSVCQAQFCLELSFFISLAF